MSKTNSSLFKSIPSEIRPIVTRRNILACENARGYDALLGALIEHIKPKSMMQWLNVKKLQDLLWEQFRMSRIKPGVMESAQKEAIASLLNLLRTELQDALIERFSGAFYTMDGLAGRWFFDKEIKNTIEGVFQDFNYSQDTIDAVAFMRRAEQLTTFENMQMSNEARQVAVRRQLEEKQEVLELESGTSSENGAKVLLPAPADNDDKEQGHDAADDDATHEEDEHAEAEQAEDDEEDDEYTEAAEAEEKDRDHAEAAEASNDQGEEEVEAEEASGGEQEDEQAEDDEEDDEPADVDEVDDDEEEAA